ncbi:hypothetical protein [Gaiella occulta]|uniref:hypothetical protein n=1 Tax=Gaiella occulta TaxID=1002870 RepID=UPI000E0AB5EE|nr:hypothetical protein [Gaiella occulta]
MSRLYDRVMQNGCRPLSAREVYDATQTEERLLATQEEASRRVGRTLTDHELAAGIASTRLRLTGDRAKDVITSIELQDAVVVSAEEVADYVATLPLGTDTTSILDSVVPPFTTLLVEFQGRPNVLDLFAWGVLIWSDDRRSVEGDDRGWLLAAALIGEWKKGEPVGPIVRWFVGLDASGRAMPPEETDVTYEHGYGTFFVIPPEIPGLPSDSALEFVDHLTSLFAPALLAISLMHCRNIKLRPVDPPERLSKKHERKAGKPLTRYHVLEIAPMRRILDTEGEEQTKGLGHALHICRGHFKTFTQDAPSSASAWAPTGGPLTSGGAPRRVWSKRTTASAWTATASASRTARRTRR